MYYFISICQKCIFPEPPIKKARRQPGLKSSQDLCSSHTLPQSTAHLKGRTKDEIYHQVLLLEAKKASLQIEKNELQISCIKERKGETEQHLVSATQERAALADERERIQTESDRINLERLKVQLEVDRATLVNKQLQNQKTKLEITQLEQLLGIQNIVNISVDGTTSLEDHFNY